MTKFGMLSSGSVVALLLAVAPLHAKESRSSATTETSHSAKRSAEFSQHLDRGMKLYEERKFSEAIEEFQQAYERQQLPRILYNMARAHLQLGHAEEALGLHQKFLRLEPNLTPDVKQQAQEDIAKARGMLEAAERIQAIAMRNNAPAEGEPAPAGSSLSDPSKPQGTDSASAPLYKRWWFWAALGGAAAAVTGAVVGGVAGYRAAHPPLPIDQVPAGVGISVLTF